MENIQIKITECESESFWYSDKIGEIFTVDDLGWSYEVIKGECRGEFIKKHDAMKCKQKQKDVNKNINGDEK